MKEEMEAERKRLACALNTDWAAGGVCIVFDNIDVALGSKSFVKAEVDKSSPLEGRKKNTRGNGPIKLPAVAGLGSAR